MFLYVWLQLMLVELFEVNTYFRGLDLVFHTPMFEPTLPACPFHLLIRNTSWMPFPFWCVFSYYRFYHIFHQPILLQLHASSLPNTARHAWICSTPHLEMGLDTKSIQKHPKAMLTFFRTDSSKRFGCSKNFQKAWTCEMSGNSNYSIIL